MTELEVEVSKVETMLGWPTLRTRHEARLSFLLVLLPPLFSIFLLTELLSVNLWGPALFLSDFYSHLKDPNIYS